MKQFILKHVAVLLSVWTLISGLPDIAQAAESSAPPPLLLANELGPQIDPAKYLVSEKYDGARALWDGKVSALSQRPIGQRATVVHCQIARPGAGW